MEVQLRKREEQEGQAQQQRDNYEEFDRELQRGRERQREQEADRQREEEEDEQRRLWEESQKEDAQEESSDEADIAADKHEEWRMRVSKGRAVDPSSLQVDNNGKFITPEVLNLTARALLRKLVARTKEGVLYQKNVPPRGPSIISTIYDQPEAESLSRYSIATASPEQSCSQKRPRSTTNPTGLQPKRRQKAPLALETSLQTTRSTRHIALVAPIASIRRSKRSRVASSKWLEANN